MPLISTFGGGSAKGFGMLGAAPLFAFTTFTFTPGPAVHDVGPTYSQLISAYNTTANPWLLNTNFFSVPTNGFQKFTVPQSGAYRITAAGARGADDVISSTGWSGGAGGVLTADFNFTRGEILYFVVGQTGQSDTGGGDLIRLAGFNGGGNSRYNAGAGGGGSDVRRTGTALSDRVIVGGGGGGGSHDAKGGAGGYPNGANGLNSTGGTQTSGFALGEGQGTFSSGTICVGGCGGGYWGGTVVLAHGNTGSGGSSYFSAAGSLVSHTTGGNNSTGYITLTRL